MISDPFSGEICRMMQTRWREDTQVLSVISYIEEGTEPHIYLLYENCIEHYTFRKIPRHYLQRFNEMLKHPEQHQDKCYIGGATILEWQLYQILFGAQLVHQQPDFVIALY